jgi:hypothetical protein
VMSPGSSFCSTRQSFERQSCGSSNRSIPGGFL